MRGSIKAAAIALSFLSAALLGAIEPSSVEAEVMTIEADGQYIMSDDKESPADATERARDDAKRNAIEQVSIYVESISEAHDGVLTKDVIRTVSSNVLQIQSSDINIEVGDNNELIFHCHIVALFDDEVFEKLREND